MKQPTKKEIDKEYKKLKSLKPIEVIAKKHGYTAGGIRLMMRGGVDKWKPVHFKIFNDIKNVENNLLGNQ